MFGKESSAFWFYGRLSPAIDVPPFFAQEIPVCEGVRIEIIFEHLGIWAAPGTPECKEPMEVTQLARLVVGSWALISGSALEWSLDGWIEAKEAELAGSVMGHSPPHFRDPGAAKEDSHVSQRMRAAAELAIQLRGLVVYRLALRDIHTALREETDDAVFFAFRAVENAARAITGISGELGSVGWARFHQALGRTPEAGRDLMAPLSKDRTAVGHGDVDPDAPMSWRQRSERILLARRLLAEALVADAHVSTGEIEVLSEPGAATSPGEQGTAKSQPG